MSKKRKAEKEKAFKKFESLGSKMFLQSLLLGSFAILIYTLLYRLEMTSSSDVDSLFSSFAIAMTAIIPFMIFYFLFEYICYGLMKSEMPVSSVQFLMLLCPILFLVIVELILFKRKEDFLGYATFVYLVPLAYMLPIIISLSIDFPEIYAATRIGEHELLDEKEEDWEIDINSILEDDQDFDPLLP